MYSVRRASSSLKSYHPNYSNKQNKKYSQKKLTELDPGAFQHLVTLMTLVTLINLVTLIS